MQRLLKIAIVMVFMFQLFLSAQEEEPVVCEYKISDITVPEAGCTVMAVVSLDFNRRFTLNSICIKHDPNVLKLVDIIVLDHVIGSLEQNGTGFSFDINDNWGSATTPLCMIGYCFVHEPGENIPLVGFVYEAAPGATAGMKCDLKFGDTLMVGMNVVGDDHGDGFMPDFYNGTATIKDVPCGEEFLRGDVNHDETLDVGDVITMLNFLFSGESKSAGDCMDAYDVNDDGNIDIGDPIYALNYLFTDGTHPPLPFPQRGYDLTTDKLLCE